MAPVRRATATAAVIGASLLLGAMASSPESHVLVVALLGALGALVFLLAPPEFSFALATVVVGTYTLSDLHPLHFGGTSVYSADLVGVLFVIRGALPRDRVPGGFKITPVVMALAALVYVVFLYADWRGHQAGLPLRSLVREPIALLYFPAYIFGTSRMLRERSLRESRLYRYLAIAVAGFILLMAAARVTGVTFDSSASFAANSNGYKVVTADGTVLRRDYGFPSAFILYPLLSLYALAIASYSGRRSRWITALAVAGSFATLLTLIRGEIFGLGLGAAALFLAKPRQAQLGRAGRARSALMLVGACVAGAAVLAVVSPALASGLVQRTLPGLVSQGTYASKTAEDRVQALTVGYHEALRHPLGLGFESSDALQSDSGVDPLFVTHSTAAWLLVFTGWPGLLAVVALVGASIVGSFQAPCRERWHHAAFVGAAAFFVIYSIGTFGLVGQPWVIAAASVLVAFRFTQRDATAYGSERA